MKPDKKAFLVINRGCESLMMAVALGAEIIAIRLFSQLHDASITAYITHAISIIVKNTYTMNPGRHVEISRKSGGMLPKQR